MHQKYQICYLLRIHARGMNAVWNTYFNLPFLRTYLVMAAVVAEAAEVEEDLGRI